MIARSLACAALALAATSLAACSSSRSPTSRSTPAVAPPPATTTTTTTTGQLPGTGRPPITIGDKNYTEQFVLGQLYYEALQAQGFSVSINKNIGPDQVRMQQLETGQLNLYPEYLNVWNANIAGNNRHFTTLNGSYAAARDFALRHGLELLSPSPFSDTYGIGVTANFAQQYRLRAISDMDGLGPTMSVGGPPQYQQDPTIGLPALEHAYGFVPSAFTSLEIGNQYKALDQDTVQAAYVSTTDGEFTTGNYSVLLDPKKVFGIGNVVPVVTANTLLQEGPAFAATVNKVTALLSLAVIRELNALVDLSGETPAGVASRFLADHGLIPPTSVITT